jgi:hypothetical protein
MNPGQFLFSQQADQGACAFVRGKEAELRGKEMVIIMNGKIDSNLVQYDSQEFLRSHRLIGV